MKLRRNKVRIGIVGCGAIGSRVAHGIRKEFKETCQLNGLYDIDRSKAERLAKKLSFKKIVKESITELIKDCDCMVEAVSAQNTRNIVRQALEAKKDVLSMSVGKLLNASDLFRLANQNKCHLLLPSGAIAGIDAIKAASLVGFDTITLTTRKPPSGFYGNSYLLQKGIDPLKIKKETVLFEGRVAEAIKNFPRNINVAATLALASQSRKKLTIRVITSPDYKMNSHEIDASGKFGRIRTETNNVVCPDNPKTSYLAVLSGLQTLKQYCSGVIIGT
jgi:aspartate dehydrogenase